MKKTIPLPPWALPTLGLVLFAALFAYVFRLAWNTTRLPPPVDLGLISLVGLCGIALLRIVLAYHHKDQSERYGTPAIHALDALENSSFAALAYDTSGTIVWSTQGARVLFPHLTEYFKVGEPYSKIAQQLHDMERTHRGAAPNARAYFSCLRPYEKKLGPALWISTSEDTHTPLTLVTFTKISEHKEIELSLRISEGHLQHLLRLSNGLCADDESAISALLTFGCQSLGFSVGCIVHTEEVSAHLIAIHTEETQAHALPSPIPFPSDQQTHILQSSDVVTIPNRLGLAVRIVVDGHVWGYVAFLSTPADFQEFTTLSKTDLVRLIALSIGRYQKHARREETFKATLEKERQASRLRLESLAHMSHELRTPLNAIIGFSDAMVHEIFGPIGTPKYRDYASSIKQAGHHLLGIVNDTLDAARIQAGHLILHDETVSLPQLIQETRDFLHERAEKAQITLHTDADTSLRPLRGDPRRLRQVLLNLVSNALKFTPAGGTVTIKAWRDNNKITQVHVSDTGVGMREEDIATAMTPFGQVDNALAHQNEGTGLGLPLSRTLMEAHGGTLTLSSRIGHGTTAALSLPSDRLITP